MEVACDMQWLSLAFLLGVIGLLGCAAQKKEPLIISMSSDADAKLIRVRTAPPRQVIEIQETDQYEDDRIFIRWDLNPKGLFLTLRNTGKLDALKVLWDEVVVSDVNQIVYDVRKTVTPRRIPEGATALVGFSGGDDEVSLLGSIHMRFRSFASNELIPLQAKPNEEPRQKIEQVIAHGTKRYLFHIPFSIHLQENQQLQENPKTQYVSEETQEFISKEAEKWMTGQLQAFKDEVESHNGKSFSLLIPMLDAGKEIEYLFTFRLHTNVKN